jgi:hypothetical protein
MFSVSKCRYVFRLNEKKEEAKKEKEKSHHFQFRVSEKEERDSSFVSPKRVVKASKEDAETTTHTHTHRHMFAATNIVISTPTKNTTSLFSSTRRHHQKPSSSRRPHPFFVCASSLKSTRKQQEKDDRKTVDDVDRRDVLTKAALVASVAMTTMTPKPVRARTFCKRRRRR